jgi:Transposase DDE domain
MPLPACLFARAYRCRRFKGEADFGKDTLLKHTFYGFRVHMRVCWPGLITRLSVAPANAHELSVLPELLESTRGLAVGDRNYWSRQTKEELERSMGVALLAPYRTKKRDPAPQRSALLSRFRYRIDTVFSQLSGRYSLKRVWAKDLWHLAGRLLDKVLSHTVLPSCSTTERVTVLYSSPNSFTRNPHIGLAKHQARTHLINTNHETE